MAVTSAKLRDDASGDFELRKRSYLFELPNYKYIQSYVCITNAISDGPAVVRESALKPRLGDPYVGLAGGNEFDNVATCVSITVNATKNPYVWIAICNFDRERVVGQIYDNPLLIPPELQWSFATYDLAYQRDQLNFPIVNSSAEAFDPPLTKEASRLVLTIVRNVASFDKNVALQYQDSVNAEPAILATVLGPTTTAGPTTTTLAPNLGPFWMTGVGARQARIRSYTGIREADFGFTYWRNTVEIEFRPESYDTLTLDKGYRDFRGRQFLDPITKAPLSTPTLLNGNGVRLSDCANYTPVSIGPTDLIININLPSSASRPGPIQVGTIFGTGEFNGFSDRYLPKVPTRDTPFQPFLLRIEAEIVQVNFFTLSGIGTINPIAKLFINNGDRGFAGTIAASHTSQAVWTLEPYYLRFRPYKVMPFIPLGLPVE